MKMVSADLENGQYFAIFTQISVIMTNVIGQEFKKRKKMS